MLISVKKEIIEFTACKGIHQEIERPEVPFRLIKKQFKSFLIAKFNGEQLKKNN